MTTTHTAPSPDTLDRVARLAELLRELDPGAAPLPADARRTVAATVEGCRPLSPARLARLAAIMGRSAHWSRFTR